MQKKKNLFYVYVILGFILNIFIFPIGGLNFLKSALTALTDLDNNVEVKKVVIESDGYVDKSPGSWHMEKSADWTSPTNAKIVFDVNTNPSFRDVPNFDVIMVLDVSGSMDGTKLDKLKDSAKKYVNDILDSSNENNIALIQYETKAAIVTPFINDIDKLTNDIDGLSTSGCTNYYAGLKKVEELLVNYEMSQDRGLVVLFMTDGAANEDTSMIGSQYKYLKDKYPDMKIVGIQYEMSSKITEYLKKASDVQYDAYMDDIYDHFYEATFGETLNYYEKVEIIDYINNDYFEVLSEDDIKVSIGSVKLETNESRQKVIWTIGPNTLITSADLHMEINAKLKKEYQKNEEGYYPTNKGVEVTTKLPDEEEKYTESDKTPVLRYGRTVYYDGNYPSECDMTYNNEETHYWYESVEFASEPPICKGYKFSGWEVESKVEGSSDNGFIMPNHDVYVKGTWGKAELVKSTEGTVYVAPPPTLYNIMKYQSVPDNITSAYVTGESGINFKEISSDTNGKGVYMIADTVSDEYPIYYYRGAVDNNNILFADLCWKMVRTTETGGVKLIYNGISTDQDGKKICNNSGADSIVPSSYMQYYDNKNALAYAGYTHGVVYPFNSRVTTKFNMLDKISMSNTSTSNYYYATTISYDNGKYTLGEDATQYKWSTNYTKLSGYYTCFSYSTTCTKPYYIATAGSSTAYVITLTNGDTSGNFNKAVLSKNIEDNGDGTYTLKEPVTIRRSSWDDHYGTYENYYICGKDFTQETCPLNDLIYITYTTETTFSGYNMVKYRNSFIYDNETNMYTLTGDEVMAFDAKTIKSELNAHHYTCLDATDTCTNINYVYYLDGSTLLYITISDGKGMEEAFNESFTNENNSKVKDFVENTWYASNMTNYTDYLEDTVWCSDRGYEQGLESSGWGSTSGTITKTLSFNASRRMVQGVPSLACSGHSALTVVNGGVAYPVGLLTTDEVVYAGGIYDYWVTNSYLSCGREFWTMSPNMIWGENAYASYVSSYGGISNVVSGYPNVRPVISLKPNTLSSSGTGDPEDPYVVITE